MSEFSYLDVGNGERTRRVTIHDVAKAVDVSTQTVSAVINNKPGITIATQEKVRAAIAQLGYKPNLTARSLRTQRTQTIALMVSDISSPVAGNMAIAAENLAYQAGYNFLLYNTQDDVHREKFYVSSILQRSVDGVLYISARDESSVPTMLQNAGIPVVVIDRKPKNYAGPYVVLDNFQAGYLAGKHLLSLGHRDVLHIGGPDYVSISSERLSGLRTAIAELSDTVNLKVQRANNWKIESGYVAMQQILSHCEDFSGVFAAGDLLAVGAMKALHEAGRKIPGDVSLIGVDDIEISSYLNPPLTTISQSIAKMAETAMHILLGVLSDKPPVEMQVTIQPFLVERNSTRYVSAN